VNPEYANQRGENVRWILVVVGVLLVLIGGVWFFQGIGILLGSVMTSQPFWAIAGAVVVIIGLVLCFFGLRRRTT
jgi:hypothetical protein